MLTPKANRNNRVSLEIIKALIQACHRDLNLFSRYVVKILNMTLSKNDIELVDLSCEAVKTTHTRARHKHSDFAGELTNWDCYSLLFFAVTTMDQRWELIQSSPPIMNL